MASERKKHKNLTTTEQEVDMELLGLYHCGVKALIAGVSERGCENVMYSGAGKREGKEGKVKEREEYKRKK